MTNCELYQEKNFESTIRPVADAASRKFHLTDDELLTHLNHVAPQKKPWQMHRPLTEMLLPRSQRCGAKSQAGSL